MSSHSDQNSESSFNTSGENVSSFTRDVAQQTVELDQTVKKGTLYVVATPIGNLADISYRAVSILGAVDCIAAEDTRRSTHLLQHYAIKTPLIAVHEHNEREVSDKLVAQLQQGATLALISDAGTPTISDPGFYLIRQARAHGLPVVPIPGASAVIAALSVCGLATDRFCFEGFLPAKSGARCQRLEQVKQEARTLVFYESPHRIVASLQDLVKVFGGERRCFYAREITKTFETLKSASLQELLDWVASDHQQQKGEIVLIVAGAEAASTTEADCDDMLRILLNEVGASQAAKLAARLTGRKKRDLYNRALELSGSR